MNSSALRRKLLYSKVVYERPKPKGKSGLGARKRRPKLNLLTATLTALEFLEDALILTTVGELLSDYSERGVDPMVAKSTREAALRISRAGKAVVEARIAAQALRDDLERLFARERRLH